MMQRHEDIGRAAGGGATTDPHCISFNSQAGYSNGRLMCTTACMHIGMAVICGKLRPGGQDGDHVLNQKLNHIMGLSNNTHSRLERNNQSNMRMVSVNDIIRECNLDLPKFGIHLEELFIAHRSQSGGANDRCKLVPPPSPPPPLNGNKRNVSPMKVHPSTCFIAGYQLPKCMAAAKEGHCSVALATSNGHTVCLIHYWDSHKKKGRFALADPFPGVMYLGMNGDEMVHRLSQALALHLTDEEDFDSSSSSTNKRRKGYFRSEEQHCDISLMYRMLTEDEYKKK